MNCQGLLNLSPQRRNVLVKELVALTEDTVIRPVTLDDLEALDEHATTMM
jgi:hypothetical protein